MPFAGRNGGLDFLGIHMTKFAVPIGLFVLLFLIVLGAVLIMVVAQRLLNRGGRPRMVRVKRPPRLAVE
jgi:hypothetical protein